MIRAYHADRGDARSLVLIPASAHGTNPASAALCGYKVRQLEGNQVGLVSAEAVRRAMDDQVAALMITNPNTIGLFEREIVDIAAAVHERGGLVYLDGANLNALMGVAKPAHMGADVLQFNLHKTFSTPHGGGGAKRWRPIYRDRGWRSRTAASAGRRCRRARSVACAASTATSACSCAPTPSSRRSAATG
jgi:glycine dehydrogenase subunit 2